jgi:hypothetical protein
MPSTFCTLPMSTVILAMSASPLQFVAATERKKLRCPELIHPGDISSDKSDTLRNGQVTPRWRGLSAALVAAGFVRSIRAFRLLIDCFR